MIRHFPKFKNVIKYYQQNINYPRSKWTNPTRTWMHPTLRSRARNVFGVQLYKNNARALLLHSLSIVNSDWLQHARSVRGVYEYGLIPEDSKGIRESYEKHLEVAIVMIVYVVTNKNIFNIKTGRISGNMNVSPYTLQTMVFWLYNVWILVSCYGKLNVIIKV